MMGNNMQTLYRFKPETYEGDLAFYFGEYKGHVFVIDHVMPEDETGLHVWVHCVDDPTVGLRGYVHRTDLEEVV